MVLYLFIYVIYKMDNEMKTQKTLHYENVVVVK